MKKSTFFLFLLTMCLATVCTYAQDTSEDLVNKPSPGLLRQKKFTVAVQPLQIFNWGIRHDFEFRLDKGPGWLQFGTTFYYAPLFENDDYPRYYDGYDYGYNGYGILRESFSGLKGGGLDVNYKRFVNPARTVYFATGLAYARFNVKYVGLSWKDFIEDGLQYHTFETGYHTQAINRWGINAYFGHQPGFRRSFIFDMFWGLGWRYSFSDANKPSMNRNIFSYGYTGIVFLTGVRIGFGIK